MIGSPVRRKEDYKLITGRGTFVDDIKLPGMLYAVFVRSPVAHARIVSINTEEAQKHPGVVKVFTAEDLKNVGKLPTAWVVPDSNQVDPNAVAKPLLAEGKVRYVGEPVAMVVAETREAAYDAAELVDVEYEELPAVVNIEDAIKGDAPKVHDVPQGNIALKWRVTGGDVEKVFSEADRVIKQRIYINRAGPVPMEPRACVASYDKWTGKLTAWITTQNPHIHRVFFSLILGLPEHKIRIIAPDVGGGFGGKIPVYTEELTVSYASMVLGRPVKWTETRSEHFVASIHGRDFLGEIEVAVTNDGKLLGLRGKSYANMGAYLSIVAPGVATVLHGLIMPGPYDLKAFDLEMHGVFTHTPPLDADRGAGRPEAIFYLERMVDIVAQELGMDPFELRKKNYLPAGENVQTVTGLTYDSIDFEKVIKKFEEVVDYKALREEQEKARKEGRLIGIGIVSSIDICGFAPSRVVGAVGLGAGQWESAVVRMHPTGKVTLLVGTHAHGQGSDTTYAQIVSEVLGVPVEDVEVLHGDTDETPMGWGTYGSRGTSTGGSAVYRACERLREKGKKIAAHMLKVSEEEVEFEKGTYRVKNDPEKKVTIQEVAFQANMGWDLPEGVEPGFEAEAFFDPPNFTYPFGIHCCVVEVDKDTGEVKFLRYVSVDDAGRIINPTLAEGQIHGGIVHGIGHAMYENIAFTEDGQLLTGSFNEYALPKAHLVPKIESYFTETPSPANPLGAKGIGEEGAIAAQVAVANAIIDALKPLGVKHLDGPYTPARIWKAIKGGKS